MLFTRMTAQVNDIVFHRKISFSIVASKGRGLFDPIDFGLKVQPFTTACWRGYVVNYEICDHELLIRRVSVGLAPGHPITPLFGTQPVKQFDGWVYETLTQKACFNGGLLLATGLIPELYVHMGFHPAWKYEQVRELIFKDGSLVYEEDKSAEVSAIRKRKANETLGPPTEKPCDVKDWIDDCFTQSYTPGSL